MILFLALIGGGISRIIGGGSPSQYIFLPMQWVFAIPYGIIFTGSWWGIPAYVCAALGKRTAHYPYFTLGNFSPVNTSRVPKVDFIVRFFFGPISAFGGQYWRDVCGLALCGLCITLVPGLIYGSLVDPARGALLALSGVLKAPAYMIELFLYKWKLWPQQAVLGEFLEGAFLWGALAWVL